MVFMTFHILGISSQLTFIFFRGVESTNQVGNFHFGIGAVLIYMVRPELRMPRSFPIFFTQKIEPYSCQGGLGAT